MARTLSFPALILLLSAGAASAQDFFVYGGLELEYERDPGGAGSEDTRTVTGYVEVEKLGFYTGLSVELARVTDDNLLDLYIGYRSETAGGLSYYADVTRTNYFNVDGDYTSFNTGIEVPIAGSVSGTVDYTHYFDPALNDLYVGVAVAATDQISLSANYGTYGVADAEDQQEWDFGVEYALGEEGAVDLRYYNGTEYVEGYVGLTLSWDTTILSR